MMPGELPFGIFLDLQVIGVKLVAQAGAIY